MGKMKTNRDLYKAIEQLLKEKANVPVPSLEIYLSNLMNLASRFAQKEALSLEEFFAVLRDAFENAGPIDNTVNVSTIPEFEKWKARLAHQIQDLREMAQQGQLENEHRYFGISAPSGRYWYNFDSCTYIECGMAGSLGGWEEGDETGRSYVPGPVACLGPDGKLTSCDPRELDQPPREIANVTWDLFSDFIWYGQSYE